MGVYIALIVVILVMSLAVKLSNMNADRKEKVIAFVSVLLIFLVLALKKDTVGIDIAGYKRDYVNSQFLAWGTSMGHFETGYITLMMVFSKIGVSFQGFSAFLYFIWCSAIYLLIRKYSTNAMLSILIFLCYQFFVFSISGLRQTLAMALCVYALLLCMSPKTANKIGSIALIVLAVLIHRSAIVFFAVPVVVWLFKGKVHISAWLFLFLTASIFRKLIWKVVAYLFGKTYTNLELGGSFIFLLGMTLFVCVTYFFQYNHASKKILYHHVLDEHLSEFDPLMVRGLFLCLICYFVFAGGTMLRASMYFTLLLIPGIPSYIKKHEPKTRFILSGGLTVFLIVLFYHDTLLPNQLELCPYRFFWQ